MFRCPAPYQAGKGGLIRLWLSDTGRRSLGVFLRRFPKLMARVDLVALLDEWAARFFEELDYVREGNNATKFAEQMREELPQVRLGYRVYTLSHTHRRPNHFHSRYTNIPYTPCFAFCPRNPRSGQ